MALSTISGPHTSFAPCLRANNRVGTEFLQFMIVTAKRPRTTTRADHGCQHKTILEVGCRSSTDVHPKFCRLAGGGLDGEQESGTHLEAHVTWSHTTRLPCRCAYDLLANRRQTASRIVSPAEILQKGERMDSRAELMTESRNACHALCLSHTFRAIHIPPL